MTSTTSGKQWYAFYTRPKLEKKISQEINDMKIENYLPLHIVLRRWSDRVKRMVVPLFPNYLFVKMEVVQKHQILSVDGVVNIISCGGRPVSVRDSEIESIRKIETVKSDISFEEFTCKGEKVIVTKGVFAGCEGELLRRLKGDRLLIKLPTISMAVSVNIPIEDVRKR
jgi:transcription antitermination factor NusG